MKMLYEIIIGMIGFVLGMFVMTIHEILVLKEKGILA